MNIEQHELIIEALRTLFLLGVPVIAALAIAGTLAAALQTVTALHDSALAYALRLITLIVVIYLMLPLAVQSLLTLAELAFT